MDPIFLVEIIVVGLIIVGQFWVFFRNLQATKRLAAIFPSARQLEVDESTEIGVALLKDNPRFSLDFRDILQMTNDYLQRNKGSSQGERLQEIAERKSDSMEEAIETNLPLPLYIGLLATFTGVIIGLVQIALEGVSDAAIQSFIGGVVVGMVGSASGLLLTVRSNQAFKDKKEERDEGMEHYFQFLRTKVFHPEAAPVQGSIKGLRDSLAAFQDGFAQYQGQMNESLQDTLKVFNELKGAFKQVRTVGQELKDIGSIIQHNEAIIEKQAQYFTTYNQKAEAFTRKLSENLQSVDQKMDVSVNQSIEKLGQSTQSAYLKMDQFLASLEGSEQKAYANSLLERMNQDAQSQKLLTQTVQKLNEKLEQLEGGTVGSQSNTLIQTFIYMGIAAFVVGMGSGVVYLIRAFGG